MTRRRTRRRGEPLFVLGVIMLGWIGARATVWRVDQGVAGSFGAALVAEKGIAKSGSEPTPAAALSVPLGAHGEAAARKMRAERGTWTSRPFGALRPEAPPLLLRPLAGSSGGMPVPPIALDATGRETEKWPARAERSPTAESLAGADRPAAPRLSADPVRSQHPFVRRWSADGWALVRAGRAANNAGPLVATYGGSQVGAVLRYRLAPRDPHRPTVYLRASGALDGSGEGEIAAGLSARPVAALPVVLAAEGRAGRLAGGTAIRPAVMAVTEFAPIALPQGARAEFYLQAGYVGGRGATPFIDGQLKVDGRVGQAGPIELRAGLGAWGGAQRGVGRVDVGPSVTLGVSRGTAAARLALDWRFRVQGRAEPSSGPALTISAGF